MSLKSDKKIFTTIEVAQKCGMNYQIVSRWFNRYRIQFPWKPEQKVSLDEFVEFINKSLPVENEKKPKRPSVLIVDDEENVANSISRVFQCNGFDILLAENGFKAAILAKKEVPQIITIDLSMNGLDGYDVVSIIQKLKVRQKAWIIIISGSSHDSCERAVEMGADFYLQKPFSKTDLEKIIWRVCPKSA
nr:response regulator [Bacteriovorax sp. HI3]